MAVLPKPESISEPSKSGGSLVGSEDTRFIIKMMTPTFVIFVIGILFEVIYAFVLSFYYINRVQRIDRFNGLGTYVQIFTDPEFWHAYLNTILFTIVTVTIELFLGLIIALMINKKFKGRGLVRASILIPWAMPTIVNAQLWVFMFRPNASGLFNNILASLGIIPNNTQALVNASRVIPINYVALIFSVLLLVTFIVLFYNWGKMIYNNNINQITKNKPMLIVFLIFLISLFMIFILPTFLGFDNLYGYTGSLSYLTIQFPFDFIAVFMVDIWKTTPFMALLILASLQTVPDDLYKAAQVDGATSWQQFRKITLPLILPGIGVALIFRSIDAFRIYDILTIFNSPQVESISKLAVLDVRFGLIGNASAIAVFTFINIIIFSALFFYLTRRRGEL